MERFKIAEFMEAVLNIKMLLSFHFGNEFEDLLPHVECQADLNKGDNTKYVI